MTPSEMPLKDVEKKDMTDTTYPSPPDHGSSPPNDSVMPNNVVNEDAVNQQSITALINAVKKDTLTDPEEISSTNNADNEQPITAISNDSKKDEVNDDAKEQQLLPQTKDGNLSDVTLDKENLVVNDNTDNEQPITAINNRVKKNTIVKRPELESLIQQWQIEKDRFTKSALEYEILQLAKNCLNIKTKSDIIDYATDLDVNDDDDISSYVAVGKDYFEGLVDSEELLLPYLGTPGVGILYGKSCTQKSSFLYALSKSFAIRNYSDWCEQYGKVLIFQLEESRKITDKRFVDVVDNEDFNNIIFYNKKMSWTVKNKNLFIKLVEYYKPKLVIIDSLSKATSGKVSQKDSDYADFIFEYQDIAELYNVTIIFNHHELKNTTQFAGTQKLMDNVDFMFHWEKGDGGYRYLTVEKNRLADDSLDKTYTYELDFENDKWSYHGETIKPEIEGDSSEACLNENDTRMMAIIKQNFDQNNESINKAQIIKQWQTQYPSQEFDIEKKYGYIINKLSTYALIEKVGKGKASGWIPKQPSETEDKCTDDVVDDGADSTVASNLEQSINQSIS